MGELWQDEGFGGAAAAGDADDDWDEGEESIDTSVEDGFDDPNNLEDDVEEDDA
jgi:hypothetical protein